jgi:cytochrome c-type biogenesis protein CcmH
MIGFWIAAALISGLIASLVLLRAARAAGSPAVVEDPSLGVYRRQLTEIDDLAERGLLPGGEVRLARAEAARRLLGAAEGQQPDDAAKPSPRDRDWVLAAAAMIPLLAVGLYVVVGSPGRADEPYAARLEQWRKADPSTLDPPRMAAVVSGIVAAHPGKVLPLFYLAQAQFAAGEPFQAEHSLRQALAIDPNRADLWTALGELLTAEAQGQPTANSTAAFQHAVALDPKAPAPRYNLAVTRIAGGDLQGGLADLRGLAADIDPASAARKDLDAQIAQIARTGGVAPVRADARAAPAATGDQQAFIKAMVDRLAARLDAQPDDPAGWGRLIRAYAVLGDTARHDAAEARAASLFKDRPDALAAVRAGAGSPQ